MNLEEIDALASPEVSMNENFEVLDWASVYGKRHEVTELLAWGYRGGRWGGFAIAEGVLTLADNVTNYVVVNRTTGVISVSAAITNWANVGVYARVYLLTALGGVVSNEEDHRAGAYGVFSGQSVTGRHEIPVMAAAMRPRVTNGCAPLTVLEIAASQPNLVTVNFNDVTQQYAQFSIPMPRSWNRGTVSFKPIWSHPAAVTNFGVVWSLAGVGLVDGDAIGAAFGTAQTSTDTGGTTDDLYIGPESAAITVTVGSPDAVDMVFFEISRVVAAGGDTLAVDARLHGIVLIIETDRENDA